MKAFAYYFPWFLKIKVWADTIMAAVSRLRLLSCPYLSLLGNSRFSVVYNLRNIKISPQFDTIGLGGWIW
jgi:hypothetical protein